MENSDRKSSVPVGDSCFLKVDTPDSGSSLPSPNTSVKGLNLFRMISRKIAKNAQKAKEVPSSDSDDDSNSSSNSLTRKGENIEPNECNCEYFYKHDRNILVISTKSRSNSFVDNNKRDKSKLSNEYHRSERCLRFSTPCNGYHQSSGSDAYSSNDDSSNSNDDHPTTVHFSSNDSSASSSSGTSYRNSRAIVRKVLKSFNLNSRSLSCSSISQMKEISIAERREAKEKRTKKSPQKILRQPVSYTYVRGISGLPTHRVVNTRGCYNNQYSRG